MDTDDLIRAAIDEDVGPGDLTTLACIPAEAVGSARILAKSDLVVCGQDVAKRVFAEVSRRMDLDPVDYDVIAADGTHVHRGDVVARVEGPSRALLVGERAALNFLMKLSGIATHVRAYVEAAAPSRLRVADTRKTTPLWRALEKHAVRMGGAHNHRFALYDGVLIKDNHIVAAGGITLAVERARAAVHHLVRIEVEVTSLPELDEALDAGADVVLLDNMDDAALVAAVARARARRPEVLLEASGNMTPDRIRALRDVDLDVVSAGGLIHQARWVDLSMDFLT